MADLQQQLSLQDRRELALNGVQDVTEFTDTRISLSTILGKLDVSGQGMKISSFNLENGQIQIGGQIDGLLFTASREEKSLKQRSRGLVTRILK